MSDVTRITCLGDSARVEDLGILLHRGESVDIPAHQAAKSLDLREVKRQNLVSLKQVVMPPRPQEDSRPTVGEDAVRAISRSAVMPMVAPVAPPPSPATDPLVVMLLRDLLVELRGLRADLAARPVGAVVGVAGVPSPRPTVPEAPEETFIPSFKDLEGTGRVRVESTEGSGGGLDEALGALRAHRRK